MQFPVVATVIILAAAVSAYIPAFPTNSTPIAGGVNVTDVANLTLSWFTDGFYMDEATYQLAGKGSKGLSEGALVHFSESTADKSTAPTSAPWIAFISCDGNSSRSSMEDDIFTLAHAKGAVSALLYSLYSKNCVVNAGYADPSTPDRPFDIFATRSLGSSHIVEAQFGQLERSDTVITAYDSQKLNNSAADILQSISSGIALTRDFLLVTLRSDNATVVDPNTPTSGPINGGGSNSTNGGGGNSTSGGGGNSSNGGGVNSTIGASNNSSSSGGDAGNTTVPSSGSLNAPLAISALPFFLIASLLTYNGGSFFTWS
ncbi:hypothetical protein B0H34DRAFT_213711 [Crassisporium funariophilum]|nr:hypothetical protein B0H34DRAFT_213711 [Crassisporium funariophilum]